MGHRISGGTTTRTGLGDRIRIRWHLEPCQSCEEHDLQYMRGMVDMYDSLTHSEGDRIELPDGVSTSTDPRQHS